MTLNRVLTDSGAHKSEELGRSAEQLHLPCSRSLKYLKERDLQAVRVLEPQVVIAPRRDNRRVDQRYSMCEQPLHGCLQVGHL